MPQHFHSIIKKYWRLGGPDPDINYYGAVLLINNSQKLKQKILDEEVILPNEIEVTNELVKQVWKTPVYEHTEVYRRLMAILLQVATKDDIFTGVFTSAEQVFNNKYFAPLYTLDETFEHK